MKALIRREILQKRRSLTSEQIFLAGRKINENLMSLREYAGSKAVLLYSPFDSEVPISLPLIGKAFFLPRIKGNMIEIVEINDKTAYMKNDYGIDEPVGEPTIDTDRIDIAIIPGSAFGEDLYRIGYGKGYYDRLLSTMRALKVGIAYDFQIVKQIPHEPHDVKMDMVVTESRVYR